jgi:hypothetical protein
MSEFFASAVVIYLTHWAQRIGRVQAFYPSTREFAQFRRDAIQLQNN